MAESVPGFEVALRYGLAAPAGTPRAIIARLNKELNAALAAEDVKTGWRPKVRKPCPARPKPMPPISRWKKRNMAGW